MDSTIIAAIDIGANMIRMTIAQVEPDSSFEILEQLNRGIRLGQDTFCNNRISADSMRGAVAIFRDFKRLIDHYQVRHIRCVATTAVREAINADTFLDRIFMASGIQVEILDPSEESHLILTSVWNTTKNHDFLQKGKVLIAEVGGGNTLLTVLNEGKLVNSICVNTGTIRLRERYFSSDVKPAQYVQRIESHVENTMFSSEGTLHLDEISRFIVVGSDARYILSRLKILAQDNDFTALPRKKFEQLFSILTRKSEFDLTRDFQIPSENAQRLIPASVIYRYLFRQTKLESLWVAPTAMREGLLLSMAWNIAGLEDKSFSDSVIDSACALGEKFMVDLNQSRPVADLSTKLFDLFTDLHGLKPRHRLMLTVASLLHEAGFFINSRAHHKHSYYLIANSDIFGLSRSETEIVAQVARYYRKSAPKVTHETYMALPRELRVTVSKLAAFLRVADAISQGCADLNSVELSRDNDDLHIICPSSVDPLLTRRNLAYQGKLFEDIYGVRLLLEER